MAGEVGLMYTLRMLTFSPQDRFLGEVHPNDILSATMSEQINAEHSLSFVTTAVLEKEWRILLRDTMGKWREFVVTGSDERHENGERPFGEYHAVWSLQHDLKLFKVDDLVGYDDPVSARSALEFILRGTRRWTIGTVTRTTESGANMMQTNGWDALVKLIEMWGGEIDVTIEVDNNHVTARKIDLLDKIGNQTAMRRFDYSRDMSSIHRKVDEMPIACGIRPYGKSETIIDDIKQYLTIEEVNDGLDYILNDDVVDMLKLADGEGGYEYPIITVENSQIEYEEDLLEWAQAVLEEYTTPKVTYSSEVIQFAAAGMDVHGVALGDVVQCVDKGFTEGGIRIQSRVVAVETNLLDQRLTKLTLGDVNQSYVLSMRNDISTLRDDVTNWTFGANSTAEYLNSLLDKINGQVNADGGYSYIVPSEGIITYDIAVDDPIRGYNSKTDTWASQVVQIKGGTIRIANSRTPQGEWIWRTVFQSGFIAADVINAINVTAGTLQSSGGNFYVNLDDDIVRIGSGANFDGRTLGDIVGEVDSASQTASEAVATASSMQETFESQLSLANGSIAQLANELGILHTDLQAEISDARRFADDYLTFEDGVLTLGVTGTKIKNVISATNQVYRTDSGDMAGFGLFDSQWEMFIETARIQYMLRFNRFAWIARQNGNMTLKWTGEVE